MLVSQILIEAKAKIPLERWVKHSYAQRPWRGIGNAKATACPSSDPEACYFCSFGAIENVCYQHMMYGDLVGEAYHNLMFRAKDTLDNAGQALGFGGGITLNDDAATEHPLVMKMFDIGIGFALEKERKEAQPHVE